MELTRREEVMFPFSRLYMCTSSCFMSETTQQILVKCDIGLCTLETTRKVLVRFAWSWDWS